jgi:hypothetical protein
MAALHTAIADDDGLRGEQNASAADCRALLHGSGGGGDTTSTHDGEPPNLTASLPAFQDVAKSQLS